MDTLSTSPLAANSPEFEFWNLATINPTAFSPLHSADQLFSHGFLLPLHYLPASRLEPEFDAEPGLVEPSASIMSEVQSNGSSILSASKRWKEIFKRTEKKTTESKVDVKRRKDRKTGNRPGSAELNININIWPFSRSRSAGNNSTRSTKPATTNRKVSSAPCSRSNSSGESRLSRKSCPGSPIRPGVHLGRASPVWQAKRAGPSGPRPKGKALNGNALVNAPVCVGYTQQGLGCRSDESGGGGGVKSGNLFGFRGLFSKKINSNSRINTVLTV